MPTSHGMATRKGQHPLYGVYHHMRTRCLKPNDKSYPHYGGRGITICKSWLSGFEPFMKWALTSGWRQGLAIDRINNNKGYSPANCRWVTTVENTNNRRVTIRLKYKGKKLTLRELSELSQVSYPTFISRFYRSDMTLDEMIHTPPRRNQYK